MKKLALLLATAVGLLVLVTAAVVIHSKPWHPTSTDVMAQVAKALSEAANKEKHGRYPYLAGPGQFWPNLEQLLPYCTDPGLVRDYVTGRCGVQVCYLPLVPNTSLAVAFLKAYEANPEVVYLDGVSLPDVVCRLSDDGVTYEDLDLKKKWYMEGLERYFVHDIGNAAAAPHAQGFLPLMWEMPGNGPDAGGWVLYANGTTKWMAYPSNYPMIPDVIERVRAQMKPLEEVEGNRKPHKVNTQPPPKNQRPNPLDSPVYELAVKIVDYLPLDLGYVAHCDKIPTVGKGECKGYQVAFRGYQRLFLRYPEAQFVLVPDSFEITVADKPTFAPGEGDFYLGKGSGYHWFSLDTYWELVDELRQRFALSDGEELIPALQTRLSASQGGGYGVVSALLKIGQPALPVFASKSDLCLGPGALSAIENMGGPTAERILKQVFDKSNPNAVENAVRVLLADYDSRGGTRPSQQLTDIANKTFDSCRDSSALSCAIMPLIKPYGFGKAGYPPSTELGLQLLDRLPPDLRQDILNKKQAEDPRFNEWLPRIRQAVAERAKYRQRENQQ